MFIQAQNSSKGRRPITYEQRCTKYNIGDIMKAHYNLLSRSLLLLLQILKQHFLSVECCYQ